jgi:hypothetical protein
MYSELRLVEEIKEGEKEWEKDSKEWWNASHLCRNRVQQNTLNTVKQHRMGGKDEEGQWSRDYIYLSTMHTHV